MPYRYNSSIYSLYLFLEPALTSSTRSAEDFLPVKPAVVLILLVLGEGELHGYAIAQAVRARSDSRVKLETGPLYRHLKKLLDSGLVTESQVPTQSDRDERRRYYELTRLGREGLRPWVRDAPGSGPPPVSRRHRLQAA